jgi:hypothetical protein
MLLLKVNLLVSSDHDIAYFHNKGNYNEYHNVVVNAPASYSGCSYFGFWLATLMKFFLIFLIQTDVT